MAYIHFDLDSTKFVDYCSNSQLYSRLPSFSFKQLLAVSCLSWAALVSYQAEWLVFRQKNAGLGIDFEGQHSRDHWVSSPSDKQENLKIYVNIENKVH